MMKQTVLTSEAQSSIPLHRLFAHPVPKNPPWVLLSKPHLFIHSSLSHRETTAVRPALTFESSLPTHTKAIMRLFLPEASLQSLPKRPQEMEFSERIKTSREL